eukprot:TRINITY_DN25033_c0_g1_i1.p1 TRINITY_DN25033_c0_g1~~TRINITY_DN25033_c0_g1_i1.p1  ORF type:complete len:632 (+),score=71.25 TRINITY_DN25033_c0_g1_i1:29-1897(+)
MADNYRSSRSPHLAHRNQSQNSVLVKDDIGRARATCRDLPPVEHAYGFTEPTNGEGVHDAMTWNPHTPSRAPRMGIDYEKLNKTAVKHRASTPQLLSKFRASHPGDFRQPSPGSRTSPKRGLVPSDVVPGWTYGRQNQASESIKEVLANDYGNDMECEREERYRRYEEERAGRDRPLKIKMTKGAVSYRRPVTPEPIDSKDLWKMSKFKKVDTKLDDDCRATSMHGSASTPSYRRVRPEEYEQVVNSHRRPITPEPQESKDVRKMSKFKELDRRLDEDCRTTSMHGSASAPLGYRRVSPEVYEQELLARTRGAVGTGWRETESVRNYSPWHENSDDAEADLARYDYDHYAAGDDNGKYGVSSSDSRGHTSQARRRWDGEEAAEDREVEEGQMYTVAGRREYAHGHEEVEHGVNSDSARMADPRRVHYSEEDDEDYRGVTTLTPPSSIETAVTFSLTLRHATTEELHGTMTALSACIRTNFSDANVKLRGFSSVDARQALRQKRQNYASWGQGAIKDQKARPVDGVAAPEPVIAPLAMTLVVRHTSDEELGQTVRDIVDRLTSQSIEGVMQLRSVSPPGLWEPPPPRSPQPRLRDGLGRPLPTRTTPPRSPSPASRRSRSPFR